ncbi:unnamed protein product [Victoria cruziana]
MAAAGGIIAKRGWQYYHYQLQTNPLLTKAVTVGVLAGCSDSIAQKLSGIQKLQFKRLLLKVLYGFAYGGPFGHFFHKIMDIIFQGRKGNKTAAKKFWPLVGWINHRYMPLQFRVVFHSFVACCWGIFLNLRARKMYLK